MKHIIGIVLVAFLLAGFSSCYNVSIKKPENLILKNKFVDVMIDMYIAQAVPLEQGTDSIKSKITHNDLYFSVLKKHQLSDSIFIQSLIYYSSLPKEYEKMHEQIMNTMKEKETEFTPKDQLNTGE
jgi:TRAP-type C4-dicarboxylate transport system substrate-binding protein